MSHIREEELSAYLDRQLGADENRALESHLAECESCHAVYAELREVTCLFREAERFEPSPFLWNRIAADIEKDQPSAFGWKASIIAGLRNYGWGRSMTAAVLTLLVIAGIAVFWRKSNDAADRVALAEIDRVYQSLAAQDPDSYNPFSSGLTDKLDANPFRSLRLGGRTISAPPVEIQH